MTQYITDLIISVLAIGLGYAMLRYSLGRYLIFVNEKKYDSKKVSKVAGTYIMAYGFISIILLVVRYFTQGNKIGKALDTASIVVMLIIGALIYYNIHKSCKIEKQEEAKQPYKKKKKKKKKKKR